MRIMVVQAVTSVRVGDGTSIGAVDLPLARERHTRWPFVPGSGLKGALRDRAHALGAPPKLIERVFGSEPPGDGGDDDELIMGSLRIEQVTLLALPVRSLTATFALLCCPTALARFGRAAGVRIEVPRPALEEACFAGRRVAERVARDDLELGAGSRGLVFVEDLDLVGVESKDVADWSDAIARFGGPELPLEHLVVVHDDVFAHACRAWTEVRTRNAVGPQGREARSAVRRGAAPRRDAVVDRPRWRGRRSAPP